MVHVCQISERPLLQRMIANYHEVKYWNLLGLMKKGNDEMALNGIQHIYVASKCIYHVAQT